ncbi:hypothetical protein [Fodinicola feengrottensis]|uniref:hypothetical protein n=1 Tax=Fodinicola feengrottensis TaxID=435914 RepID=UPI0036F43351
MENLTDELAHAAWKWFQDIEKKLAGWTAGSSRSGSRPLGNVGGTPSRTAATRSPGSANFPSWPRNQWRVRPRRRSIRADCRDIDMPRITSGCAIAATPIWTAPATGRRFSSPRWTESPYIPREPPSPATCSRPAALSQSLLVS